MARGPENILHFVRHNRSIAVSNLGRIAERLLLQLPIFIALAFGLIFMLGRFIAVLRENFKEAPDNWASAFLLVVLIGGVSVIVVLASVAAGAVVGFVLRACFAKRLNVALSRHSRSTASCR